MLSNAETIRHGRADILFGTVGDDVIIGLGGDDQLYGYDGNDTLTGGAGNDTLTGGIGNDTYLFGLGDGADTIIDSDSTPGNIDTVQFAAGIQASDIVVTRVGDDLISRIPSPATR